MSDFFCHNSTGIMKLFMEENMKTTDSLLEIPLEMLQC